MSSDQWELSDDFAQRVVGDVSLATFTQSRHIDGAWRMVWLASASTKGGGVAQVWPRQLCQGQPCWRTREEAMAALDGYADAGCQLGRAAFGIHVA